MQNHYSKLCYFSQSSSQSVSGAASKGTFWVFTIEISILKFSLSQRKGNHRKWSFQIKCKSDKRQREDDEKVG